jgi:hypothetical protein
MSSQTPSHPLTSLLAAAAITQPAREREREERRQTGTTPTNPPEERAHIDIAPSLSYTSAFNSGLPT